ncbi:hypothetical protein ACLBXM_18060 [Xanthobacteraceae bacterium A53D]
MRNRDRIYAQPLGTSRRLTLHKPPKVHDAEIIAEMDSLGHGSDEYGWMARMPTGTLIYVPVSGTGGVKVLDQRKAELAYKIVKQHEDFEGRSQGTPQEGEAETPQQELARLVKAWRGDMTIERAAEVIGLPYRTLEGIEQGRGFRYPKTLILAMKSFD